MARYQHVWLLAPNGGPGLSGQPSDVNYFSPTGLEQAWPSHRDYEDASILTDGDDSTRFEFLTEFNANNPDFHGFGQLYVDPMPEPVTLAESAELVVYYRADIDHRVTVKPTSAASVLPSAAATAVYGTTTTDPSPLGAGWRKARLTIPTGETYLSFAELFESSWMIEIIPPHAPDDTQSFQFNSWVSEIAIGYAVEMLAAPPCRLFPRDDGLGVGSGRHYPPPKSQQRSSRRFGYY